MQLHKSNVKSFFSSKKKIMFHRLCSAIGYLVEKKIIFFSSTEGNAENSSMVSIKIGKYIQDPLESFFCVEHTIPTNLPLIEEYRIWVLVSQLCNVL